MYFKSQLLGCPACFVYSGAGKSTLMNVLAHRNISQIEVRGTVKVNNCPIGSEITAISAYIQQEDLMVGSLTVKEHLTFQVSELNWSAWSVCELRRNFCLLHGFYMQPVKIPSRYVKRFLQRNFLGLLGFLKSDINFYLQGCRS